MPIGVKASKARAEIAAREAVKAQKAAAPPAPAFARQARVPTPLKHPKPKKPVFRHKRGGACTPAEKEVVAMFVADQPAEITRSQELGLSRMLGRTVTTTKKLIQEARQSFVDRSQRYVDIHAEATEKALALAAQDPRYADSAIKSAQWAMTNISTEGQRIIDKPDANALGTRVFVGIKLGGVETDRMPTIDVTPSE